MKQAEIFGGLSGVSLMIMIVCFALLGMKQPITLGNVVLGMIILSGGSVLIGGGLFVVLVICFGLLRREPAQNEVVEDYYY
ncbi:hypothetical protein KJZ63_01060 [Patescibacteria group bacterium]|nr:hypothetical protein [Patescibacteria group bacterium]